MPKTRSKKVKKGKIKIFLFFLFVTFFMWMLTKFSNEYTATIAATIYFKDLPNNMVLVSATNNKVSFDLTSSGFDFLTYKLKKPVIGISVADYYNEKNKMVQISHAELIRIISSELKSNLSVKNVSLIEISLPLDSIISREIPIKAITDIRFQTGFKAIEGMKLTPSSIKVSGPSSIIDSLKEILTKPISIKQLNSEVSGEIELNTSNNSSITLSEKKVNYLLNVEEFTQKELLISIKVENLPKGIKIKLMPEEIPIIFDVSVSNFKSISKNDFIIVCDYNKRNVEENYMIPDMIEESSNVQNLSKKINKVKYLIFK